MREELGVGVHDARRVPGVLRARVNSIHHQAVRNLAPGFTVEAWSEPDRIPEAIRRLAPAGRDQAGGYIAATQWHPEFHKVGGNTLDDTPILMDFLSACTQARARQRPPPRSLPGQIRDRAARMLRQALLARGD